MNQSALYVNVKWQEKQVLFTNQQVESNLKALADLRTLIKCCVFIGQRIVSWYNIGLKFQGDMENSRDVFLSKNVNMRLSLVLFINYQ